MQSWAVTESVEVAQKFLDTAIASGANDMSDPQWKLRDPDAAETKAYASALEKARGVAEQMARSFGAKIGPLLYATNQNRAVTLLGSRGVLNTEEAMARGQPVRRFIPPNCFLKKLKRAPWSVPSSLSSKHLGAEVRRFSLPLCLPTFVFPLTLRSRSANILASPGETSHLVPHIYSGLWQHGQLHVA